MSPSELAALLARLATANAFDFALDARHCLRLDLSQGEPEADPRDAARFGRWLSARLAAAGADYAAGGYGEDRPLYRMSDNFTQGEEPRTLHLGIDLWIAAGTPVHAVLGGVVHSVADNAAAGDYGPTVILEHGVAGLRFHTLYGHLARRTLERVQPGHELETGAPLGWLGAARENGGWPPHLHFQVIAELGDGRGDYPGVCRPSERMQWLARCPDPNLLLRIDALR